MLMFLNIVILSVETVVFKNVLVLVKPIFKMETPHRYLYWSWLFQKLGLMYLNIVFKIELICFRIKRCQRMPEDTLICTFPLHLILALTRDDADFWDISVE